MKKMIYLMLCFLVLSATSMNAQVSIGTQIKPHKGAVLDLKAHDGSPVNKGLLLPNVMLETDLTIFVLDSDATYTPANATGMMVYNLRDKKVYVWDGAKWMNLIGSTTADISISPDPAGISPVPSTGGSTPDITPSSNPVCSQSNPFTVSEAVDVAYASVEVLDPATGKFKVTFQPNPGTSGRSVVVTVKDNCTGDSKNYVFNQEGTTCVGITSVSILPNTALSLLKGDSQTFTATTNTGADSPTYRWYVNGALQSGSSNTFTYAFNAADAVTINATAVNACTQTEVSSSIVNVTVTDPANIPDAPGTYYLTGTTCFDVAQTTSSTECGDKNIRTNAFASQLSFAYTFHNSPSYSDLKFQYVDATPSIVESISPSGVLTFKSNVASLIAGNATGATVTVYAIFKNDLDVFNKVALSLKVKDCQCCGLNGVAGTLTVGANTYLTHMYGDDCWMVSNSKEGTPTSTTYESTTTTPNPSANGYYYTWAQAAGACPTGWHLPTTEFKTVKSAIGSTTTGIGQWWNAGSAFAGVYYGSWNGWGSLGYWWSALSPASQAYFSNGTMDGPYPYSGSFRLSVRCVQNK